MRSSHDDQRHPQRCSITDSGNTLRKEGVKSKGKGKKKKPFKKIRQMRKKLTRWLTRVFVFVAKYTLPYLYVAYMKFVWITSEVIEDTSDYDDKIAENPHFKCMALVWHQDVVCVAWAYRKLHRPSTLASVGHAGELITHMLKLCNFRAVLRGGSSKGIKRRKKVLDAIISDMKDSLSGICGITVDGSSGPAYRVKRGIIACAKECNIPIMLARTWCKRKILLPTWDRTMVPLPFNKIYVILQDFHYAPEGLDDPEKFEKFRSFMEHRQLDLTYKLFTKFGEPPAHLMKMFPEDWKKPGD